MFSSMKLSEIECFNMAGTGRQTEAKLTDVDLPSNVSFLLTKLVFSSTSGVLYDYSSLEASLLSSSFSFCCCYGVILYLSIYFFHIFWVYFLFWIPIQMNFQRLSSGLCRSEYCTEWMSNALEIQFGYRFFSFSIAPFFLFYCLHSIMRFQ